MHPVKQIHPDNISVDSTVVQSDGLLISQAEPVPSKDNQRANSPPMPRQTSWPFPPSSDTSTEKKMPFSPTPSFSHSFDTRGSPPSYQYPFSDSSGNQPGSRFSWHVTPVDRARNWFTVWFVDWWAFEILSWLFSALCLVIIMAVLLRYNGKELPHWRMGFTLNAFISVFSGFAKSALLLPTAEALGQLKWNWFGKKARSMMDFEVLDGASRGAWGSFVLLAKTKGVTLASVGAAIILLSLPLDLFYQQIVGYPTVWTKTGIGNLTRSVQYDPLPFLTYQGGNTLLNPNPDMLGLLAPYFTRADNFAIQANVSCPTPKCTWEPFETLAVCSACKPVEGLLQYQCLNSTSADWASRIYDWPTNVTLSACGWWLMPPTGLAPILVSGYEVNQTTGMKGEVLVGRNIPLSDVLTRDNLFPGGTINFQDIKNPIADFLVGSTPDGVAGTLANKAPELHECEVHWCVQTVESTVIGSLLTEKVTKSQQLNTDHTDNPWGNPKFVYLPEFKLTLPDRHAQNGSSTYGLGNMPSYSNRTARGTKDILEYIIPASFGVNAVTDEIASEPNPTIFAKTRWGVGLPLVQTLAQLDNPWSTPHNISQHVAGMAAAMSATIRKTAHGGTNRYELVHGDAMEQRTQVKIRWLWVILPAALLLFSLAFLIVTVIKSSREDAKIGVWKSSALAILFNGPGEEVQDAVGSNPTRLGSIREKSKNLRVTLQEDP